MENLAACADFKFLFQLIVTLCRKKLVAPPAASSGMPNKSSSMLGTPDMMIPVSRPLAVRSAAPPPVAAAPDPSPKSTLFDDKALTDNASSRYRAAEEAQRRADDLVRKEKEAAAKNKNALDPFAHLKEEFAGLIHDLYGSQNDPAMAAVGAMFSESAYESCYLLHALPCIPFDACACTSGVLQALAWKKKLLYGNMPAVATKSLDQPVNGR